MRTKIKILYLFEGLAILTAAFLLTDILSRQDRLQIESCSPRTEIRRTNSRETAITNWEFQVASSFDYTIKEKIETDRSWLIQLHIDKAKLKLGLDIEEILPQGASTRDEEIENAHAAICKRVFFTASKKALESGNSIFFNRTFSGEGKTVDEASAQALQIARSEFLQDYSKNTQEMVADIIEVYDFQMRKDGAKPFPTVEEAFKIYLSGRPRKV